MQQSLYTFRVLTAQSKLVLQQVGDATSGVTRDSRVISSNQKAVFTQIAAVFFVEGIENGWYNAQHRFPTRCAALIPNKLQNKTNCLFYCNLNQSYRFSPSWWSPQKPLDEHEPLPGHQLKSRHQTLLFQTPQYSALWVGCRQTSCTERLSL